MKCSSCKVKRLDAEILIALYIESREKVGRYMLVEENLSLVLDMSFTFPPRYDVK